MLVVVLNSCLDLQEVVHGGEEADFVGQEAWVVGLEAGCGHQR